MPARHRRYKASLWGAFLISGLVFSGSLTADCPLPGAGSRPVTVRHVYDGDTVILADQSRVRLIGINTPELGSRGRADQPLAIRARDRLRQLLFSSDNRARLRPGVQSHDRHGRLLAHLYTSEGKHLAETLLREGLGWMVAVAPNLSATDCLMQAEKRAENLQRGVWSIPEYAALPAHALKLRMRGFRLVTGRVSQVYDRHQARWIGLDDRLLIRIPDSSLSRFSDPPDPAWHGRQLRVRGWLYARRGKLRVKLDHPAALEVLDTGRAEVK